MIRGLAGLVSTNGTPIDPGLLEDMVAAMGARADHRHAQYTSQLVTLVSGGPVAGNWDLDTAPTDARVIADLRLDNRLNLSRQLSCPDADDAVVSHAYARWGRDCAEHLHGDFAIAVWDPRTTELFLARDRFGTRPLVYTQGDGWFAFASEAKALLALPGTSRDSSELRIGDFLAGRMPQADTTMFDAIKRLPAGHCLTVGERGVFLEPYWTWKLPPAATDSDLPRALAEVFSLAVSRRVPDDVDAAVTLSGGLDSSSVAATMASEGRYSREPVATYSIVFDRYPELSERRFIEALIDTGGFEAHFLDLDVEDPFEGFSELLARQDGLFLTPGLAMGRSLLSGLGRGTVVLDGHGGDEVISDGYERLHELAERRQWFSFWIEAVGASRITGSSPWEVLAGYYALYGRGGSILKRVLRRLVGPPTAKNGRAALISDRLGERLQTLQGTPTTTPPRCARERHMAVLADPAQQHVLEVLDREAVGRGHEARSPFWDEDLIAFMLSVPAREKLRGGRTRRILREAMQGRLPDMIRWRRDKHHFNHHLIRGLQISPAASAKRFERDAERLSRYMQLSTVTAARDRVLSRHKRPINSDTHLLWRATAVAEWLDHADRNGIRIVE